jgi:hypothetical protein
MFTEKKNRNGHWVEDFNGWHGAMKPPQWRHRLISLHTDFKTAYEVAYDWYMDMRERAE